MLNHITLMGRFTKDPEIRKTGNDTSVTGFTIACDRDYSGKDGTDRQTDFIDCVAWRNTAEFIKKYFQKGSMAVISGRLQLRDWKDKEGNNRRSAEVIVENIYFGGSKNASSGGSSESASKPETETRQPQQSFPDFELDFSDDGDLPF